MDGVRVGLEPGGVTRPAPAATSTKEATMTDPTGRFWSKVDRRGVDECWLWMHSCTHDGYGQFKLDNRMMRAHRVAYLFSIGAIPDDLQIDHLCRNRRCCNPMHMELVTTRENTRRGSKVKLTLEQARAIKRSTGPGLDVAAEFGVTRSTVYTIRNGQSWKDA
jgi:hypothetical protein